MTIEQIKDRAKQIAKASEFDATQEGFDYGFCMTYEDLDKLIDSTHQATVEEIIKIIEHDKEMIGCYEGCKCRSRLIKAIKK